MILHYDTETTGFLNKKLPLHDPSQPRIVQLGAILDSDDGREIMRFDVIIAHADLPQSVSDSWLKAQEIHGVSEEFARQVGVNEQTAIHLFLDMLEVSDVVVGQNIKGFDNELVTAVVRRVTGDFTANPFANKQIFDTMLAGQPLCRLPWRGGGFKKPNLTELHKHLFGEGFEGAHTAISDVLAARRCFYELQRIASASRQAAQ